MQNIQSGTTVTVALIAINVVAFLTEGSFGVSSNPTGWSYVHGALFGPLVADSHEYWRLATYGFLHAGLIHIGFNMYLLYLLGQMLEPALGPVKFGALYFTALIGGALGALVVDPHSATVGASGAVFGLMGAAVVEMRARGIDPMQSGIGGLIVINLVLSFVLAHVSVGGHIGGLIAGALAGYVIQAGDRRRSPALAVGGCVALTLLFAVLAVAAAGGNGING